MKDIKIPKEINEYEAKLLGSFTARQSILLLVGVVLMFIAFLLLRDYFYSPVIIVVCSLILLPFIALGWLRPWGVKPERIIRVIFTATVRTKRRGYKINNKSLKTIKSIFSSNKNRPKKRKKKEKEYNEDEVNIQNKKISENFNKIKKKSKEQLNNKNKMFKNPIKDKRG
ncbi:PrgI family protein [uncultured Anaerococcus sp.]|uniref:PrgI family protein n=1 Tax=uncultured Anaerococcus sp. TaxID=293428 RepID=UPI0025D7F8E7|nr:PrgI family protein [uncultured Anaerococcus sp.]